MSTVQHRSRTARRILLAMAATATLAAAADPLYYERPHDITLGWGRIVGLGLAAVSALLILYVLLFRRKRILEASSRWLLFLGICVIPLPLSLLSTAVGLEKSKSVEFCASCHAMDPFVEDMKDPKSKTLAAVHYRNAYIQSEHCYRCHTNYGIFGTMEAKMAGLGHIWKDGTGSYDLPVEISKPYRYTICLDCHGASAKFRAVELHQNALRKMKEGEDITCIKCHFPRAHPPREERGGPR
jgi:nitrate/TMAO reductase-like tetraheme cytochrome c subunit